MITASKTCLEEMNFPPNKTWTLFLSVHKTLKKQDKVKGQTISALTFSLTLYLTIWLFVLIICNATTLLICLEYARKKAFVCLCDWQDFTWALSQMRGPNMNHSKT